MESFATWQASRKMLSPSSASPKSKLGKSWWSWPIWKIFTDPAALSSHLILTIPSLEKQLWICLLRLNLSVVMGNCLIHGCKILTGKYFCTVAKTGFCNQFYQTFFVWQNFYAIFSVYKLHNYLFKFLSVSFSKSAIRFYVLAFHVYINISQNW